MCVGMCITYTYTYTCTYEQVVPLAGATVLCDRGNTRCARAEDDRHGDAPRRVEVGRDLLGFVSALDHQLDLRVLVVLDIHPDLARVLEGAPAVHLEVRSKK